MKICMHYIDYIRDCHSYTIAQLAFVEQAPWTKILTMNIIFRLTLFYHNCALFVYTRLLYPGSSSAGKEPE